MWVARKSIPAQLPVGFSILLAIACGLMTGCATINSEVPTHNDMKALSKPRTPVVPGVPNELAKTVLPPYIIEPPDILVIDVVHMAPRPPYRLRTYDIVGIAVPGAFQESPIQGAFPIEPGGTVNLGPTYGSVNISGMTVEQAQAAIEQRLSQILADPRGSVTLIQMGAQQQVSGNHLVGPDGTVTLGTYGSVKVVGMTLEQARMALEAHLSQFLETPEVSVDVFSYNSKVYYVIAEGAGLGDTVTRFPVMGNETVLDAISNINGLTQVSSKRIWIARPTPHTNEIQLLPVDWQAITATGSPATNYQVLPGDRIFIAEDKLVALDTSLGKIFAPIERVSGFILLGVNTVGRLTGNVLGAAQGGFGAGFGGGL